MYSDVNRYSIPNNVENLFKANFIEDDFKSAVSELIEDKVSYEAPAEMREVMFQELEKEIRSVLSLNVKEYFNSFMNTFSAKPAREKIKSMAAAYFDDLNAAAFLSHGVFSNPSTVVSAKEAQKRPIIVSLPEKSGAGRASSYNNLILGRGQGNQSVYSKYIVEPFIVDLTSTVCAPFNVEIHEKSLGNKYEFKNLLVKCDPRAMKVAKTALGMRISVAEHTIDTSKKIGCDVRHFKSGIEVKGKPIHTSNNESITKMLWVTFNNPAQTKLGTEVICLSAGAFKSAALRNFNDSPENVKKLNNFINKMSYVVLNQEASATSLLKRSVEQANLIEPQEKPLKRQKVGNDTPIIDEEIEIDLNQPLDQSLDQSLDYSEVEIDLNQTLNYAEIDTED